MLQRRHQCHHVLLADEPLANLDLAHAARLMALLRSQANMGMGTVLVLHDLATARNHADRVLVIDEGLVIADAPPASALDADVIRQVWNLAATWVDTGGRYALCVG